MLVGIDLTSSEDKGSACAFLHDDASLLRLTSLKSDDDILGATRELCPSIVAIDAPLGFPKGMCCLEESCPCRSGWPFKGRAVEQELARRGIPLYFTTKRSIIKKMVYRGIRLASELSAQGHEVLEVYPYASKVALFGKPIPRKTTAEGLEFLREKLSKLVPGLSGWRDRLDHDLCDALIAGYTAYLHKLGRTESVGVGEEVRIVMPATAATDPSEGSGRTALSF